MRFSPPPLSCYHIAMKDFPHHLYCITTLVSHLTCPLPPHQSVIPHHCMRFSPPPLPCHCITASLCHCITTSPHEIFPTTFTVLPHCHERFSPPPLPHYRISQSFDLPSATTPVSHTTSLHEIFPTSFTMSLHHCVTA